MELSLPELLELSLLELLELSLLELLELSLLVLLELSLPELFELSDSLEVVAVALLESLLVVARVVVTWTSLLLLDSAEAASGARHRLRPSNWIAERVDRISPDRVDNDNFIESPYRIWRASRIHESERWNYWAFLSLGGFGRDLFGDSVIAIGWTLQHYRIAFA